MSQRVVAHRSRRRYRCRVHNRFGSSERIIFLRVDEPPEAPSSVQLAGASSRWIRVRWRSRGSGRVEGAGDVHYWAECEPLPGDAAPPLNLTLDTEEESVPDSQGYRSLSALVAGVRPAAAYAVRVLAANRAGRSPRSEPLLVTTLEEEVFYNPCPAYAAPSGPPRQVRVRPVDTREMHVSWMVPVQHTWNGELVGYAVRWRAMGASGGEGAGRGAGWAVVRAGGAGGGGGGTELRVRGLREFTRYEVTVLAFNAAGLGPPSQVVYAATVDGDHLTIWRTTWGRGRANQPKTNVGQGELAEKQRGRKSSSYYNFSTTKTGDQRTLDESAK
ncbi:PREDICTED: Down syndrome cell adhesion molecule-like protein Dscam2 [Papilio polytes]|uniref:Down syndrome cell adhesion molecule-like protein Dscam2 n=1 Tax=Papilio polytes TaxID=76194 RepID=UPI0006763A1F|nr:PREDICTED: Down syndrome cell adhesion molecule-like protein Dscam2 [Papilio polytes]